MYDYTDAVQERLNRTDHGDIELQPENAVHDNAELLNHSEPLGGLANFTDSRMAVMTMMICVNSETKQSRSNSSSLVEMVSKAAKLLVGDFVVMDEAENSVVVAVGQDMSASADGSPVKQLLTITAHVINEVRTRPA